jgi:hypothetical protein
MRMKKLIFTFLFCLSAMVQSAWGFTSICPSGQKLSYKILNLNSKTVSVGGESYANEAESMVIPATVTYNGVTYSVVAIQEEAFVKWEITSVIIPNTVTSIGKEAFPYCSLTSVTIPTSVTSISSSSFYDCYDLTDINVSESNTNYQSIDGILYNKAGDTLICCPSGKVESVTVPTSVKFIEEEAFSFSSLMDINVSESNTNYQSIDGILYNKSGDILICCPSGKVGGVIIPISVTTIKKEAFFECEDLTSVIISSTVDTIENSAFDGCSSLMSVTVKAKRPPVCFSSFSVYDTLYVPKESVDLYKSTSPWSNFKNIIGVSSDVPTIKADVNLYVAGTELHNKNNEQITIYDTKGNVVLRSDESAISLEELPHGMYVVVTSRGNMKVLR